MFGSKTKARAALVAVFALVFMTLGLTSASAQPEQWWWGQSITAQSNSCESVTIYYNIGYYDYWFGPNDFLSSDSEASLWPAFNAQGTVDGVVKNTNGSGTAQIVFTNVTPGLNIPWSGSMWWEGYGPVWIPYTSTTTGGNGPEGYWDEEWGTHQFSNEGLIDVEPCPVTTSTTTPSTTVPVDTTTSSTLAQVETDLPTSGGSSFGMMAALAAVGVSLLGGAAIVAARREN